jgi:hypothetical protein
VNFYIFPKIDFNEFSKWKNDREFVMDLFKKTGLAPFMDQALSHIRLTFLLELKTLEIVYNLIEGFLK